MKEGGIVMKKSIAVLLTLCMVTATLMGCGNSTNESSTSTTVESSDSANSEVAKKDNSKGDSKVINLWSFTDEVPKMIEKYIELHPDFGYEVKTTIIATTDGAYQPALDQALAGGGADAPDIYCAEAAFVLKYTQGDASSYAAAYKDLGIDIDSAIKDSAIAQYSVDIGTNTEGNVVGLGYQATGGAFIYRRSIAKEVWGSDDPAVVGEKIGAASGSWDKFYAAAKDLKAKGFGIVSGD